MKKVITLQWRKSLVEELEGTSAEYGFFVIGHGLSSNGIFEQLSLHFKTVEHMMDFRDFMGDLLEN